MARTLEPEEAEAALYDPTHRPDQPLPMVCAQLDMVVSRRHLRASGRGWRPHLYPQPPEGRGAERRDELGELRAEQCPVIGKR